MLLAKRGPGRVISNINPFLSTYFLAVCLNPHDFVHRLREWEKARLFLWYVPLLFNMWRQLNQRTYAHTRRYALSNSYRTTLKNIVAQIVEECVVSVADLEGREGVDAPFLSAQFRKKNVKTSQKNWLAWLFYVIINCIMHARLWNLIYNSDQIVVECIIKFK